MALTKVKLIADGVITSANLDASHGITTSDIGEGSNLYYTDSRVSSYLSTNGFATQTDIVAAITDSAPVTLDTLNELAAALGDDPNFATTTATSLGLKAPLASPSFTGNATFAGNILLDGTNQIHFVAQTGESNTEPFRITRSSDIMYFTYGQNAGDEAFYIKSDGNVIFEERVGIGIASPSSLLHLLGADATVEIQGSGVNSTAGVNFFPRDGSDVAHLQSIKGVGSSLTFLTGGNSGNSYVPTERMRIDSSGNVKIGNSTTGTPALNADDLVIDKGASESGITLISTAAATIRFGDAANTSIGSVEYNHNSNYMRFSTNNAERLRIETNGNLLLKGTGVTSLLKFDSSAYGQILSTSNILYYDIDTQVFRNSAGTTERMRITSAGNIGIGLTNPQFGLSMAQGTGDGNRIGWNDGAGDKRASIICSSSTDALQFHTGTSDTERMRIDSSGNVKINTTVSTLGKLSVKSDSGVNTFYNNIQCVPSDSTTGGLFIGSNATNDAIMVTGAYYANAGNYTPTATSASLINMFGGNILFIANNSLTVGTNYVPTERMRITSGGNVNIGVYESGSSTITGPFVVTHASTRFMTASYEDSIVSINSKNNSNTLESLRLAGAYIVFYSGSGTTGSERMRITSGGEVLIRRVSSASTSFSLQVGDGVSDSYRPIRCEVASTSTRTQIAFHNPGQTAAVGAIQTYNTSTVYTTGSDYRLKENVVPMKGALDRVDQLKPSRFNFIGYEEIVDGFLAHEVQNIVPEAIIGIKDEVDTEGNPVYQGIDQSKLVPLLVGAIKELKAEIEILKTQINN